MALLVSELINNAVLHGGAAANDKVTLRISVAPERVRVEVSDAGVGFRRVDPQRPSPDGTGGYGLVLVEMLASRGMLIQMQAPASGSSSIGARSAQR